MKTTLPMRQSSLNRKKSQEFRESPQAERRKSQDSTLSTQTDSSEEDDKVVFQKDMQAHDFIDQFRKLQASSQSVLGAYERGEDVSVTVGSDLSQLFKIICEKVSPLIEDLEKSEKRGDEWYGYYSGLKERYDNLEEEYKELEDENKTLRSDNQLWSQDYKKLDETFNKYYEHNQFLRRLLSDKLKYSSEEQESMISDLETDLETEKDLKKLVYKLKLVLQVTGSERNESTKKLNDALEDNEFLESLLEEHGIAVPDSVKETKSEKVPQSQEIDFSNPQKARAAYETLQNENRLLNSKKKTLQTKMTLQKVAMMRLNKLLLKQQEQEQQEKKKSQSDSDTDLSGMYL